MSGAAAIQDLYPENYSHCYGCGRLNEKGLHIRSHWTGEAAVARLEPQREHVAMPGFVYGGLVASLIDCHSVATAAAAAMVARGELPGVDPSPRYVTGSLHVDFVAPTPVGQELEVRAHPVEVGERKVTVVSELSAGGTLCARGRVVAVRLPAGMAGAEE